MGLEDYSGLGSSLGSLCREICRSSAQSATVVICIRPKRENDEIYVKFCGLLETYVALIKRNRSLRAELSLRLLAGLAGQQRLHELKRRHEVQRVRLVVLGHVDRREVHLELATARHVGDRQDVDRRRVAHAVPDEQRRLVLRPLEDFQPR